MGDIEKEFDDNKKEHKELMEKLDDFGKQLVSLMLEVKGLPEKILEKTDRRYASKTTEKAVYGMIGAVILAVMYALVELLKK